MPSLIMKKGGPILQNIQNDSMSKDSMDPGHICFSCEQIFANRRCLEEHVCSSVIFICSCGTEFTEYNDMLEHSGTHEPGHQVLDHETIRKRRNERRKEEEEKLKRLTKGEVIWKAPDKSNSPSAPLLFKPDKQMPNTSSFISPNPLQHSQTSQLQEVPSSQSLLVSNPLPALPDTPNIFSGVGAPTVDLWTLYQPVVLLKKTHKLSKKPYLCGKCGQEFMSKASLIFHHNSHVTAKISGCIGCGLLLSGKKFVPRFHACKSQNNQTKQRLITAKPPGYKPPSEGNALQNLISLPPQVTSILQLENQNTSQALNIPSIPALKNQNIRTYNNNRGLNATASLQAKSKILNASKPGVSLPFRRQVPTVFSQGLHATSSPLLKRPTNSASPVLSKPIMASTVNGFTCRVCHLPFSTPQLLQRHKCARAQEFMARHMTSGKRHYKLKKGTPVQIPNSAPVNGQRKLVFSPGNTNNELLAVSLDKAKASVPVNGAMTEDDDDCYIVEGESDNPAEMIYKVTSSVPIKT